MRPLRTIFAPQSASLSATLAGAILILAAVSLFARPVPNAKPQTQSASVQTPVSPSTPATSPDADQATTLPRGKKLVLKDGTFQIVRSYQRNGDRVRYYSEERGDWEEIPAALVDWPATAEAETEYQKESSALVSKIHAQELSANTAPVVEVDASLPIAPDTFLPSGEGMFILEGHIVRKIEQVGSEETVDKGTLLKQVLLPVPIVRGKHNVDLPGTHAITRITISSPEFYLREAAPDPERDSAVEHSSRAGQDGPDVELVRATVKNGKRHLESIRDMFGQQVGTERKSIAIQRWEVAPQVYRFTLGESLPPGEYALAEMLQDGMNLYVWDFAVDPAPNEKSKHK